MHRTLADKVWDRGSIPVLHPNYGNVREWLKQSPY